MNRRGLLLGIIAAPLIVRPEILMPIRVWKPIMRRYVLDIIPHNGCDEVVWREVPYNYRADVRREVTMVTQDNVWAGLHVWNTPDKKLPAMTKIGLREAAWPPEVRLAA